MDDRDVITCVRRGTKAKRRPSSLSSSVVKRKVAVMGVPVLLPQEAKDRSRDANQQPFTRTSCMRELREVVEELRELREERLFHEEEEEEEQGGFEAALDKYFHITEHGSTVCTEVIAGMSVFCAHLGTYIVPGFNTCLWYLL